MGGSGKTPVVIYLSQLFVKRSLRTAVISRGYKGKATEPVNIVSDGETIYLSPDTAGDEPCMIAELAPGSVVLTGKKRVEPCRFAQNEYHSDLIILDDGFQHLKVKRNLDIVLFNGSELYNHFHVVPGGILREPMSALNRASCICITGCNKENISDVKKFTSYLQKFDNIPIFHLETEADGFVDTRGNFLPLHSISNPVVAFCGIASPKRFKQTLINLSIDPSEFVEYGDHTEYTPQMLDKLESIAVSNGAKFLLTTQKDMVKLRHITSSLPILALSIHIKANCHFEDFILKNLRPGFSR